MTEISNFRHLRKLYVIADRYNAKKNRKLEIIFDNFETFLF